MKKTKGETASRCSGRCKVTYASVRNYNDEVTVRSVRKRQLNVRTGEPVPGTEQILPIASVPAALRELLRGHLQNWFVYRPSRCLPGCFCNPIGRTDVESKQLTYTINLVEKQTRAQGWITKGADTREQVFDDMRSGRRTATNDSNGQPLPINPDLDELDVTAENCCGQITIEFDVKNWFEYEFEITGTLWLCSEIGKCDSIDAALA